MARATRNLRRLGRPLKRLYRRWCLEKRLRSGEALQGPESVQIGIDNRCNYRCAMCACHSHLLPPDDLRHVFPRPLFAQLIADLQSVGTRSVEICGSGEPLLHPEAAAMLRTVKEAGLGCSLVTNGSFLTPEMCRALVDMELDGINVSLNTADAGSHEELHQSPPGDHARILEGIRLLRRLRCEGNRSGKPFISISTVIHQETYRQVPDLARIVLDLDIDHLSFAPLGMNEASAQLALSPDEDEEARRLIAEADETLRAAGKTANARNVLNHPSERLWTKELFSEMPCYIGQLFCRILADGSVYPCCACNHRVLGNVAEISFPEIMNSEAYRAFRREAHALPRRGSPVDGCACWTCGHHLMIEAYHERVMTGQIGLS